MSLAMDQIFCLAPSIRPPMEPVVSRTKQTSIRDLGWAGDGDGGAAACFAWVTCVRKVRRKAKIVAIAREKGIIGRMRRQGWKNIGEPPMPRNGPREKL